MIDTALVRSICQQPFHQRREWRAHGIGMLRTYLDDDRRVRLNLWHRLLVNPGISTMHTHPWTLHSDIIAGKIANMRWDRVKADHPGAMAYVEDRIPCGNVADPEFALKGQPQDVWLIPRVAEVLHPGQSYEQHPEEIHTTEFLDGSATIMRRGPSDDVTEASVFWPKGEEWGDASRKVTADEIVAVCHAVLAKLDL